MAFRSPFQASKRGVPFPALSPFASSPTQSSENGSPMQTSPAQSRFRSIPKRGTGLRSSVDGAVSPMDAAPYTPVSARLNLRHTPAPESASKLPGRLSFTPHATRQRSPAESASKQSPLLRKSRFNTVSAVTPVSSAADTARPAQLPSLYAEPSAQDENQRGTDANAASFQPLAAVTSSSSLKPSSSGANPLHRTPSAQADVQRAQSSTPPSAHMHRLSSSPTTGLASAASSDSFQPGPQLDSQALHFAPSASNTRHPFRTNTAEAQPGVAAAAAVSLDRSPLTEAQPVETPATDAASPSMASPASMGLRSALQWKPMGRAANTPDKQDLGRRIFGGLAASPLSSSKQPPSRTPQASAESPVHRWSVGPGKDASDQGLAISQASKQAASQESSHAESISQLQQQAIELSTAAGVPVESLSSQASLSARLVKGPESKQQALNKLTQLQAMAQQHAAKLQVRVAESSKAKQTRVAAPGAMQPVTASVPNKQTHSDAGSSLSSKNADIKIHKQTALQSVDTDGQRTVMSLLSKLKLLQDEGAQFARRLQPSV